MSARITPLGDAGPGPRTVAVGTFDGLHRGHRRVVEGVDAVVTFDPHPATVLSPSRVPLLLTDLERKAALAGSLGAKELVVVPFDTRTAHQEAEDFVTEVLVDALGATTVRVGENFRFGARAEGTSALLAADDRFEGVVVPLLRDGGETVSSTRIRALVASGDVVQAAELLGDPFVVAGTVSHGEKRGRTIGYPTANLEPRDAYAVPPNGVYACRATLDDGTTRPAAVSIGVRPQFETKLGRLVEAYLPGFDGDLYDRRLELAFLEHLRPEERFDGVPALLEQMARDVEATVRIAGD